MGSLLAALIAVVSAFLYVVDPEGTHGKGEGAPSHVYRDLGSRRGRAQLLESRRWDAVLIGSSRVALGYDTDESGLGEGATANLGLMDTNLWELLRVAEHALERTPLIVLFVDLHCMSATREKNFDFDRSSFAADAGFEPLEHFDEDLSELLSLHELRLAFACLRAEADGAPRFGRNGVDRRRLPSDHRYREDTAQHLMRVYLANSGTYLGFEYGVERIADLERFVERARAAKTRVVLAIQPKHALQLECLQQVGLWNDFERLKRDLAGIATRNGVLLADFAAHHSWALERLPDDAERGVRMEWWFDSSHFTPPLGRLVLAQLDALLAGSSSAAAPLFGVRLDASNVEAHLEACNTARDAWRAANQDEVEWISNVIRSDELLRMLPPHARR
jgi:hypothetical protein